MEALGIWVYKSPSTDTSQCIKDAVTLDIDFNQIKINLLDITHVESFNRTQGSNNFIKFHSINGKEFYLNTSLGRFLEDIRIQKYFCQVSRFYVVNYQHITKKLNCSYIRINDAFNLKIGDRYKSKILEFYKRDIYF